MSILWAEGWNYYYTIWLGYTFYARGSEVLWLNIDLMYNIYIVYNFNIEVTMTGATHVLAAAALYQRIGLKTPYLFGLAFLTHFLLDAIPHFELNMQWNYLLGACAGAFLLYMGKRQGDYKILIAGLLGVLPDIYLLLVPGSSFYAIHNIFHFKKLYPVSKTYLTAEMLFLLTCGIIILTKKQTGLKNKIES